MNDNYLVAIIIMCIAGCSVSDHWASTYENIELKKLSIEERSNDDH